MLAGTAEQRSTQPLRICELCVELADLSGAGISLVTPSHNRGVICATDDVAARIEALQLELGEGPCVDAASQQAPVMVPDVDDPGDILVNRWPAFIAEAAAVDVRAVFAIPLRIGAISVGVLDLYRNRPGVLSDAQLASSLMAADVAAISLLYLDRDAQDLGGVLATLQEAEIHQATGMVSVQVGVPIEEAFLLLRARAFSLDRPLDALAGDVVERRVRFYPEEAQ
jgi:GAF domain-containing protein